LLSLNKPARSLSAQLEALVWTSGVTSEPSGAGSAAEIVRARWNIVLWLASP
jgi:hypothetical protein